MKDHLETYRKNLRHVVRPDEGRQQIEARHIMVNDYDALALCWLLEDYIHYSDVGETHRDIARAYVEYITMVVHDEGGRTVKIFVHTKQALQVLEEALLVRSLDIPVEWVNGMIEQLDSMKTRQPYN